MSTVSAQFLNIIPQTQTETLASWVYEGAPESETLVVSFSGIGKDNTPCPPYEFARTASQDGKHNVLFIADPQRSWLNTPNLIQEIATEIETMRSRFKATRVVALGHSMGGFSALVAPAFTKIDAVLAFAPQVSIHPSVVPDEKRWALYRERVKDFEIICASDHLQPNTQYTVISGRHGREAPQRDRIPTAPNLRHYVMPQTHHNVPQRLKNLECLPKVIQFATEGRPRKLRLLLQNKTKAKLL